MVHVRDCSSIKLQWRALRRSRCRETAILWDSAGSNFTFHFVPQRARFLRASWRDFVDLPISVVDWTRLYGVVSSAKVPRLVPGVRHWSGSLVYKMKLFCLPFSQTLGPCDGIHSKKKHKNRVQLYRLPHTTVIMKKNRCQRPPPYFASMLRIGMDVYSIF